MAGEFLKIVESIKYKCTGKTEVHFIYYYGIGTTFPSDLADKAARVGYKVEYEDGRDAAYIFIISNKTNRMAFFYL